MTSVLLSWKAKNEGHTGFEVDGKSSCGITRWSPDLSHLLYEERLKILKIPQLEESFELI
jgi:hypothetical protein